MVRACSLTGRSDGVAGQAVVSGRSATAWGDNLTKDMAIPTRQASRPTIRREHGDATDRRIKHAILPNEPTVLRLDLRCNGLCTRSLRRRIVENIGGFVLENEPTGRG